MSKVRPARSGPRDPPVGPDKSLNGASPRTRARLFREGTRTGAEVVDAGGTVHFTSGGEFGSSGGGLGGFVVEYRYEAGGSPRWGTCVFLRAQPIRPGEWIDVWYDPQDPDVSVWPGAPGGGPGDWLLGAVTGWRLFVLLAVVLLGVAVFQGGSGSYVPYLALVGSLVFLGGVTVWDFTGHWELAAAIDTAHRQNGEGQLAEPPPSRDHRTRRERRQGRARHRRR